MGEGVIEAQIGAWLKAEGDPVALDEPLVEIETDKVTTELLAEQAGQLLQILAEEGAIVEVGQVIAVIGEADGHANGSVNGSNSAEKTAQTTAPPAINGHNTTTRISPVVSRMLTEHNLNIEQIYGSGKNGRVTKRDVLAYLNASKQGEPISVPQVVAIEPEPAPVPIQPQAYESCADSAEILPHSRMRRRIADHMVLSKATSPHATTVHEIDYSAVIAHRNAHKKEYAKRGVKLTFMAYLALAVVKGLQTVPNANSSWSEEGLQLHKVVNLGIAAAIDDGLVVPVIKEADTLNLLGMAQAIEQMASLARNNQLTSAEMQDGTFTITNHGVFGSLFATPIINQPQAGILGIGVVEDRVVAIDGMVAIRPKAYASFSFDHRILDGADADRFMQVVRETIESGQFTTS